LKHLITGGAGFVGSHLVDKLMYKGEFVYCLDNFMTGNISNIEHWQGNKNFKMIDHDVTKKLNLKVDKIWHLACPASPKHYQKDPIQTTKICFQGTLNMLELAKEQNADFLLASTSEVYGDPKIHPQPESYKGSVNCTGIRSCYDEGKRIAESLSFDFQRMYDLKIHVARIFNTYGPRMTKDDGRVVSNFIYQALTNKPLTIYGNGKQTRSFCFVEDLVEGIYKLMNSKFIGPINLGNPNEITILELSEIIKDKLNKKISYVYETLPEDDPLQRKPLISLAQKELGWEPNIDFNEGIKKTIDYFKTIVT